MNAHQSTIDFLTPSVIHKISTEITQYLGQEIFFGGKIDQKNFVYEITLLSRGNQSMVPVVFETATEYDIVIHNHPSSYLEPSDNDLEIAAILGNHNIGFYIVDNSVSKVNVIIPAKNLGQNKQIPLALEEIFALFESKEGLKKFMPGFETRPSQLQMLENVSKSFNEKRIYLCEAPTGTGKSLAYLIPSFLLG